MKISERKKLLDHHLSVAINQAYILKMNGKQLRALIEKTLIQRGF